MSNAIRQRTSEQNSDRIEPADGDVRGLADSRAAVDRLFAVAARSFEAMQQSDSREFLRQSRQTGGQ